jgi:preprotein translocase subunit SecF
VSFNYDFVKNRNIYFIFSVVITIVGLVFLLTAGLKLGVDFESGTRVTVASEKSLTEDMVKKDFESLDLEPGSIVMTGEKSNGANVAFKGVLSKDKIAEVKSFFNEKYGDEPSISTVSPAVSLDLAKNAIYAVIIATIGIILYVTVRFELLMAIAAIVALLHDAFIIIAVFSILRLEVDLPFIAAVLTIIGYSINDTIVTFDRIREHVKLEKPNTREKLADIVNRSIHETLTRSINTVMTVVFAALAILVFGSETIRNFSIALMIGLTFGAYSSIFIASQLWFVMKSRQLKNKRVKTAEAEI